MPIDITHSNSSIGAFLNAFAGRQGSANYDNSKQMKISENNRDFVWPLEMQQSFIVSIVSGLPIPAFTLVNGEIVDGGNRTTTLFRFRHGEFKVPVPARLLRGANTDGARDMNYDEVLKNEDLASKWHAAVISKQLITNADSDECSQIYENLNKGVQLTCGQLLKNRKHRPLVATAEQIIRGSYPDSGLVSRVWAHSFKQTEKLTELAYAFQVFVSAELGPNHFHSNFHRHLPIIMSETLPTTDHLRTILQMLDSCDRARAVPMKKKKKIFTKFIGAIICDLHSSPVMPRATWSEKWSTFIDHIYNTHDMKKIIMDTIDPIMWGIDVRDRNREISQNVARYLTTLAPAPAPSLAPAQASALASALAPANLSNL